MAIRKFRCSRARRRSDEGSCPSPSQGLKNTCERATRVEGFSASRAHTSSGRRHRTHRRRRKGGRKAWLRIHNGIVWLFLSPFPTATLLPHPPSLYRLKLSSSSFPLHPVYPSLSLSDDFSGKVIRVRNEIVNCCEATLKLREYILGWQLNNCGFHS